MINNFCVNGFKSLKNTHSININSCLFLCGPNSSGKSSFIQSILMVAQTFSDNVWNGRMVLNGTLIRLGEYEDILSHSSKDKSISISFDLFTEYSYFSNSGRYKISVDFKFGDVEEDEEKSKYNPKISYLKLKVHEIDKRGVNKREVMMLEWNDNSLMTLNLSDFDKLSLNKIFPEFKFTNVSNFSGLIPRELDLEYNFSKKLSFDLIPYLINENKYLLKKESLSDLERVEFTKFFIPEAFSAGVIDLINKKISTLKNLFKDKSNSLNKKYKGLRDIVGLEDYNREFLEINFSLKPMDLPSHFTLSPTNIREWHYFIANLSDEKRHHLIVLLDENREKLENLWLNHTNNKFLKIKTELDVLNNINEVVSDHFIKRIKYLGPLRNPPEPFYNTNYYNKYSVGIKGEFTAAMLHKKKDDVVSYLSPDLYNNDRNIDFKIKEDCFYNACVDWLSYLGVIDQVHVNDRGNVGYDLQVKNSSDEKLQDLIHVGVGVSQVLPIVVSLLMSGNDDVLIFEQPELHLHPKIQSRLCDLFLAITSSGRQCIVETHSEYIINRLRLRIAQSINDDLMNKSSLYFINKDSGVSDFVKVEINRFGAIPNWPKEFFDQSEREIEKILIAASKKNKSEKLSRDSNADY